MHKHSIEFPLNIPPPVHLLQLLCYTIQKGDCMILKWEEAYSVRVSEIDDQHEMLIDMLGRLKRAIGQNEGQYILVEVLEDLFSYASLHFQTEERYLRDVNYGELEEHKAAHRALTDQIDTLFDDADLNDVTEEKARNVLAFMQDWIHTHLLEEDRKYIEVLQPFHDC